MIPSSGRKRNQSLRSLPAWRRASGSPGKGRWPKPFAPMSTATLSRLHFRCGSPAEPFRPGGAAAGAIVGGATGAVIGAQAEQRHGYYLWQGVCYYRYPSGQYAAVDPRYCN
jgi:hypothetical protein